MSRPCRWPDGGCGADIIDVTTVKGAKQVLDATPIKRVVLVREADHLILAGELHVELRQHRARVVPVWVDHHETCPKWAAKIERERAAKAARS